MGGAKFCFLRSGAGPKDAPDSGDIALWHLSVIDSEICKGSALSSRRGPCPFLHNVQVAHIVPADGVSTNSSIVSKDTQVHITYDTTQTLIALDVSDSMLATERKTGQSFVFILLVVLQRCLEELLSPLKIPGTEADLKCHNLFVTVALWGPFGRDADLTLYCLCEGVSLTATTVPQIMETVESHLSNSLRGKQRESVRLGSTSSLDNLLCQSQWVLNRVTHGGAGSVIVITDGILSPASEASVVSFMQSSTTFSAIVISTEDASDESYSPVNELGSFCDYLALEHLARASAGCVYNVCAGFQTLEWNPVIEHSLAHLVGGEDSVQGIAYAVCMRPSAVNMDPEFRANRITLAVHMQCGVEEEVYPLNGPHTCGDEQPTAMSSTRLIREKVHEYILPNSLVPSLVDARVREGFRVTAIDVRTNRGLSASPGMFEVYLELTKIQHSGMLVDYTLTFAVPIGKHGFTPQQVAKRVWKRFFGVGSSLPKVGGRKNQRRDSLSREHVVHFLSHAQPQSVHVEMGFTASLMLYRKWIAFLHRFGNHNSDNSSPFPQPTPALRTKDSDKSIWAQFEACVSLSTACAQILHLDLLFARILACFDSAPISTLQSPPCSHMEGETALARFASLVGLLKPDVWGQVFHVARHNFVVNSQLLVTNIGDYQRSVSEELTRVQRIADSAVHERIRSWSHVELRSGCFIRSIHAEEGLADEVKEIITQKPRSTSPTGFCVVWLSWSWPGVLCVAIGVFGACHVQRVNVSRSIVRRIAQMEHQEHFLEPVKRELSGRPSLRRCASTSNLESFTSGPALIPMTGVKNLDPLHSVNQPPTTAYGRFLHGLASRIPDSDLDQNSAVERVTLRSLAQKTNVTPILQGLHNGPMTTSFLRSVSMDLSESIVLPEWVTKPAHRQSSDTGRDILPASSMNLPERSSYLSSRSIFWLVGERDSAFAACESIARLRLADNFDLLSHTFPNAEGCDGMNFLLGRVLEPGNHTSDTEEVCSPRSDIDYLFSPPLSSFDGPDPEEPVVFSRSPTLADDVCVSDPMSHHASLTAKDQENGPQIRRSNEHPIFCQAILDVRRVDPRFVTDATCLVNTSLQDFREMTSRGVLYGVYFELSWPPCLQRTSTPSPEAIFDNIIINDASVVSSVATFDILSGNTKKSEGQRHCKPTNVTPEVGPRHVCLNGNLSLLEVQQRLQKVSPGSTGTRGEQGVLVHVPGSLSTLLHDSVRKVELLPCYTLVTDKSSQALRDSVLPRLRRLLCQTLSALCDTTVELQPNECIEIMEAIRLSPRRKDSSDVSLPEASELSVFCKRTGDRVLLIFVPPSALLSVGTTIHRSSSDGQLLQLSPDESQAEKSGKSRHLGGSVCHSYAKPASLRLLCYECHRVRKSDLTVRAGPTHSVLIRDPLTNSLASSTSYRESEHFIAVVRQCYQRALACMLTSSLIQTLRIKDVSPPETSERTVGPDRNICSGSQREIPVDQFSAFPRPLVGDLRRIFASCDQHYLQVEVGCLPGARRLLFDSNLRTVRNYRSLFCKRFPHSSDQFPIDSCNVHHENLVQHVGLENLFMVPRLADQLSKALSDLLIFIPGCDFCVMRPPQSAALHVKEGPFGVDGKSFVVGPSGDGSMSVDPYSDRRRDRIITKFDEIYGVDDVIEDNLPPSFVYFELLSIPTRDAELTEEQRALISNLRDTGYFREDENASQTPLSITLRISFATLPRFTTVWKRKNVDHNRPVGLASHHSETNIVPTFESRDDPSEVNYPLYWRERMCALFEKIQALVAHEVLYSCGAIPKLSKPVVSAIQLALKTVEPQSVHLVKVPLRFVSSGSSNQKKLISEIERLQELRIVYNSPPLLLVHVADHGLPVEPTLSPYWVLVRLDEAFALVSAYGYFHQDGWVEKVLETVQRSLMHAAKQVNRRILIQSLHDTQQCSALLVPPDSAGDCPSDRGSPISNLESDEPICEFSTDSIPEGMTSGEYACECVFERAVPLHPRLSPQSVIHQLVTTTLNTFLVPNRRNMFVYREKTGDVFYIRVEAKQQAPPSSTGTPMSSPPMSPLASPCPSGLSTPAVVSSTLRLSLDGTQAIPLSSTRHSVSSHMANPDMCRVRWVLLVRIFGVERPGSEVTDQLFDVITKETESAAVRAIGTLLARNPKFKLHEADLDFIRPFSGPSWKSAPLALPRYIGNIEAFQEFLNHSFLQYMTVLRLSKDDNVFPRDRDDQSLIAGFDEDKKNGSCGGYDELNFVFNGTSYNTMRTTHSHISESAAIASSQGLASVSIRVFHRVHSTEDFKSAMQPLCGATQCSDDEFTEWDGGELHSNTDHICRKPGSYSTCSVRVVDGESTTLDRSEIGMSGSSGPVYSGFSNASSNEMWSGVLSRSMATFVPEHVCSAGHPMAPPCGQTSATLREGGLFSVPGGLCALPSESVGSRRPSVTNTISDPPTDLDQSPIDTISVSPAFDWAPTSNNRDCNFHTGCPVCDGVACVDVAIWARGGVDVSFLKEKILTSIKHACLEFLFESGLPRSLRFESVDYPIVHQKERAYGLAKAEKLDRGSRSSVPTSDATHMPNALDACAEVFKSALECKDPAFSALHMLCNFSNSATVAEQCVEILASVLKTRVSCRATCNATSMAIRGPWCFALDHITSHTASVKAQDGFTPEVFHESRQDAFNSRAFGEASFVIVAGNSLFFPDEVTVGRLRSEYSCFRHIRLSSRRGHSVHVPRLSSVVVVISRYEFRMWTYGLAASVLQQVRSALFSFLDYHANRHALATCATMQKLGVFLPSTSVQGRRSSDRRSVSTSSVLLRSEGLLHRSVLESPALSPGQGAHSGSMGLLHSTRGPLPSRTPPTGWFDVDELPADDISHFLRPATTRALLKLSTSPDLPLSSPRPAVRDFSRFRPPHLSKHTHSSSSNRSCIRSQQWVPDVLLRKVLCGYIPSVRLVRPKVGISAEDPVYAQIVHLAKVWEERCGVLYHDERIRQLCRLYRNEESSLTWTDLMDISASVGMRCVKQATVVPLTLLATGKCCVHGKDNRDLQAEVPPAPSNSQVLSSHLKHILRRFLFEYGCLLYRQLRLRPIAVNGRVISSYDKENGSSAEEVETMKSPLGTTPSDSAPCVPVRWVGCEECQRHVNTAKTSSGPRILRVSASSQALYLFRAVGDRGGIFVSVRFIGAEVSACCSSVSFRRHRLGARGLSGRNELDEELDIRLSDTASKLNLQAFAEGFWVRLAQRLLRENSCAFRPSINVLEILKCVVGKHSSTSPDPTKHESARVVSATVSLPRKLCANNLVQYIALHAEEYGCINLGGHSNPRAQPGAHEATLSFGSTSPDFSSLLKGLAVLSRRKTHWLSEPVSSGAIGSAIRGEAYQTSTKDATTQNTDLETSGVIAAVTYSASCPCTSSLEGFRTEQKLSLEAYVICAPDSQNELFESYPGICEFDEETIFASNFNTCTAFARVLDAGVPEFNTTSSKITTATLAVAANSVIAVLEHILELARLDFQRDCLWEKVFVAETSGPSPSLSPDEFKDLLCLTERTPVWCLDRSVLALSALPANFAHLSAYLKEAFGTSARVVHVRGHIHVLLVLPTHRNSSAPPQVSVAKCFVHVCAANAYSQLFDAHVTGGSEGSPRRVLVFLCQRGASNSIQKETQRLAVETVIRALCHWMWKSVVIRV
eukprot:Rmarinus@m.19662